VYNIGVKIIRPEFPVGKRIGRLVVLGPAAHKYYVRCKCSCGKLTTAYVSNLRLGKTTSCGSHRDGTGSIRVEVVYGDSKHPLYRLWRGMINRCFNKRQLHYFRYGGRGITVCKRWLRFRSFVADMGPRPKGHSLDRIDNNATYSPDNCRWASSKQQAKHKRVSESAHLIFWKDECQTLSEWARRLGIRPITLSKRFEAGWSIERAMTTAVGPSGPKPK